MYIFGRFALHCVLCNAFMFCVVYVTFEMFLCIFGYIVLFCGLSNIFYVYVVYVILLYIVCIISKSRLLYMTNRNEQESDCYICYITDSTNGGWDLSVNVCSIVYAFAGSVNPVSLD